MTHAAIATPLLCVAASLIALGIFVWSARPASPIHRWFAAAVLSSALWTLGIGLTYFNLNVEVTFRLAFAGASLIPAAFLNFTHVYPSPSARPSTLLLKLFLLTGIALSFLSLFTDLIAHDHILTPAGVERHSGPLYPFFAGYFLLAIASALWLLLGKWRQETGLRRLQVRYLALGAGLSVVPAVTTNLVVPLVTGTSTYAWIGPYFLLPFVFLIAHAIIRHRMLDLRLVIHRGLTIVIASLASLVPVMVLLLVSWSRIFRNLEVAEIAILLGAIVAATLFVAPTRDAAGALLDRYLYRTRTNYRSTVRQASRTFTRVVDLNSLIRYASDVILGSMRSESVAVYLRNEVGVFALASFNRHPEGTRIVPPSTFPPEAVRPLREGRDCFRAEEAAHPRSEQDVALHQELARLNWALVLPLLSEDSVIGAIVVGPKLSGDPYYPQDLDLLMTLANQAGIAIKNAQLYTEVVLANEYIENIVATIESGVVAVNAGGRVTRFNRAAAQLTGLVADQVLGRPADTLPEPLRAMLRATLADGQPRAEPESALPDGSVTRPVMCTTSPLRDPAAGVLGAVAVFSDLTPLKELERERRRVERLAYFEILASSLAHEIKNPVVAIKTFAQLIPRRHRDERFVAEFSRIVTREVNRMERLVERLRTLSRPPDRPKRALDVRAPLGDAVESLRPVFDEKGVQLTVGLGPEPRLVAGDHGELEQLFLNLLLNALEATPHDGAVTIDVRGVGEQTTVTVADSGPGFPPELLEHVFDPFITTKPRGSGLGLTISADIADAHRAKLRAVNGPSGGALLTVEFPVAAVVEASVRE